MKKLLGLFLGMMLLQSCGFEIVDEGYVGIKKSMGKIEMEEYKPGVHFYNPITTGIFEMDIREQTWSAKVSAYSADNQIVEAQFKINYAPTKTAMAELYSTLGDDYINKILPQRVQAAIKEVLGKYKATEIVTVRAKIDAEVKTLITSRLEGTNVDLKGFEITNYDYDDAFEQAVKDKVIAKERAVEEKNRTVQIKEQAAQKVLTAKAEAEKIQVMAKALSQNKDLIELEAVKKWDGKLPQYMMGNSVPFIKMNGK